MCLTSRMTTDSSVIHRKAWGTGSHTEPGVHLHRLAASFWGTHANAAHLNVAHAGVQLAATPKSQTLYSWNMLRSRAWIWFIHSWTPLCHLVSGQPLWARKKDLNLYSAVHKSSLSHFHTLNDNTIFLTITTWVIKSSLLWSFCPHPLDTGWGLALHYSTTHA